MRILVVVTIGITLSLIAVLAVMIGAFAVYRRVIKGMALDGDTRQVSGARLTSESLHQLPTPPWRFVFEIGENKLPGIDHVVVGPAGIIAVATVMADRPPPIESPDAQQVAASAMLRSDVDELAKRAGLRCDLLAKVFWGAPQPQQPPAYLAMHQTMAVEGQRLFEWLASLPPGPLTRAQVDLGWQAVVTGIGRPDPLS